CDDGNLIDGDGCEVDCTLTKPIPPPSPTPSATPQPGFNEGLGGGGGCSLGLGEAPREIAGSALLLLGMVFSIVLLARKAGR
ncbi:MAG TPA: hypothetical protein DF383_11195, partial [Deltaproteobacteria bacterium]|nr:hypothetical protein [Deltaproteobacteria bacterium]